MEPNMDIWPKKKKKSFFSSKSGNLKSHKKLHLHFYFYFFESHHWAKF
jgi:hypothetical protein